ncbi:MAG: hypothetical protein MUC54_03265, partial [Chloroflexi bacterium]|nr:hypothetical protein [Chloroflexota bacterium]
MTIFYLDIDDEITSAAARIRRAEETRVALVLPAGSRIATSRINFRLLAREAQGRSRRLAIVAPDASARALAASAGLPVFGSVVEYEDALAAERPPAPPAVPVPPPQGEAGDHGAGAAAGAAAVAGAVAQERAAREAATGGTGPAAGPGGDVRSSDGVPEVPPAAIGSAAIGPGPRDQARRMAAGPAAIPTGPPGAAPGSVPEAGRSVGPSTGLAAVAPPHRPDHRRRRVALAASLGVLLLAAVVVAVGAYIFLPTATVTVTPATRTIGPVDLTITVDPAADEPDAAAGTVP